MGEDLLGKLTSPRNPTWFEAEEGTRFLQEVDHPKFFAETQERAFGYFSPTSCDEKDVAQRLTLIIPLKPISWLF